MVALLNFVFIMLLIIVLITMGFFIWKKLQQFSEFEDSLKDVEREFAERELAAVESQLSLEDQRLESPTTSEAPTVAPTAAEAESPGPKPLISSENFPYRPKQQMPPPPPTHGFEGVASPSASPLLPGEDRVQSVEDLANRLLRLNIMKDKEGSLPLSIQPHGLMGRLRAGGICALLPRTVGEEEMIHLTKRFDIVFVIGRNGEVLIMERFQTRLPQLLERPGD